MCEESACWQTSVCRYICDQKKNAEEEQLHFKALRYDSDEETVEH